MLNHALYDKVKVLHDLSSLLWFIEKHGKADAKSSGDLEAYEFFEKLAHELEEHIEHLEHLVCHAGE